MNESPRNPGIVLICDFNGIILHIYRDDFSIFSLPVNKGEHLSKYIKSSSKKTVTGFFSKLSSVGFLTSKPIEFIASSTTETLYCLGVRELNFFIIFGANSPTDLGELISEVLYSDGVPVDFSQICSENYSHDKTRIPDYQIYEDFTRLNNELVNMNRELADAQVEIEMKSDELN